ncbi:ATP-dependent endonuclease [Bacteroidota bacterium]
MIESIHFKNYRCFSDHFIPLKSETIIIGSNNAGKSTIIEGLRLVSIITERYKSLNFHKVPRWLDIPNKDFGVQVSLSGQDINWQNIFHKYHDPPARIIASFDNGYNLTIHIGPDNSTHTVIRNNKNSILNSKSIAKEADLSKVSVLPQIAPLLTEEKILSSDYIRSNISTYRSSQHFRNELNLFYEDYFEEFKNLVETSWPGIQIIGLDGQGGMHEEPLQLMVRDREFVAEISWMGHGLQMWLQVMWFITRTKDNDSIILDEPDVYMHPDLQRNLIRLTRGKKQQCIISSHSTEILSEANPDDILIIDRYSPHSSFATNLPAVQNLLENIGSTQNLPLTRLWNAGRLILVEGDDLKLLKLFQNLIFPKTKIPFDTLPNMPIGGWSGWPYAIGSAMMLHNSIGEQIMTYCILDSDYNTVEKKQNRLKEAKEKNIRLHIWSKKEIENYLIVPSVIQRVLAKRIDTPPTEDEIVKALDKITDKLKNDTIDNFAEEYRTQNRSNFKAASKYARKIIENDWDTLDGRLSIVSGKKVFSELSSWSKEHYDVSFGPNSIPYEMRIGELHPEIIDVVTAIETSEKMPFLEQNPNSQE